MYLFNRNFKLQVTIISLFVLLNIPVLVTMVVVNYRANTELIQDYSKRFIAQSVKDTIDNVERLLNPINSTVRSAGALMRDKPEYFREDTSADYLHEIVAFNEAVYAAYAAYDDGSFRQVRRAVPGKPVLDHEIQPATRFIDRYIDTRQHDSKGQSTDVYRFHGKWNQVLGHDSGPANYDPRTRGYYQDAVRQKTLTVSDVYRFASSQELGITVTTPVRHQDRVVGVFAVDLTLQTLSRYLAENPVSPHSITIMADEHGNVIALPDLGLGDTKSAAQSAQNRLDQLGDPRVNAALSQRLASGQNQVQFRAGTQNTEYIAVFSPFPKDFGKPWELLTITPTDDFVGDIKRTNRNQMLFGACALLLQLALISWLSKSVSKPMERLAADVSNVRQFKFDNMPVVRSRITEVADLGQAVFLLTRALESFSSYVPRSLVRQLMESGQGTRLGVESRYLTMFFTDLEGFTSLTETEPSQQLLARVSDYFSSVTSAIEGEHGTVDKFIGDAVMAFWGAPAAVPNHSYLACVAAVRSQRRMALRNAEWQAQGMAALNVRIGIHSDAVLVGNVGSRERVSYTVMGDGVNVAARLEGMNKELGTRVCVSHAVFRDAGAQLWLRPIDLVTVKGRKGELLVYELLAVRDGDAEVTASTDEVALCTLTTQAYALYARQDWAGACTAYATVLENFPHDPVARRMMEKSQRARGLHPV